MAEMNSKLMETAEYKAYAERMRANGSDEEVTLDNFLSDMSPQERANFLKEHGESELGVSENDDIVKKENAQDMERVRSQYSDQNEIMLDRVRVKVLQSMDKVDASIDVDNLEVEQLLDEVQKADALTGDEKTRYEKEVEDNLQNEIMFSLVPPRTLILWNNRLSAEIKDTLDKDPKADVTAQQAILDAVQQRMNHRIKDVAEKTGLYFVDKTNIADVYDGYAEMIELRKENTFGAVAKKNLDGVATEYDTVFGLKGKTASDAKDMDNVAKDTLKKLEGFELSEENLTVAASMHFKDDKGNDVPQFLDDAGKPAMTGKKVRPRSQLESLIEAAKSDALDDQVLMEGKVAPKEEIAAAANDAFLLNATMLVNSDRIGHKEKAVPFNVLGNDLKSGKAYNVSPEGFEGATDAYVNKKTSKLARLGKHNIGKDAPVLGRLYEPIRKMDKLEKARFDEKGDKDKYRKQFWTGLAANAVIVGGISAGFAVASKIPGAQPYCAAASVGLAFAGMAYTIHKKKQLAHAEGKKYGVKEFFKDGETMSAALMTGVAFAAVAWGRPELAMAAIGGNMVRTGYFTRKKSRKAGIGNKESWGMTLAAVATTPLAAWGGREAGNSIANALGGQDGLFGHWQQKDGELIPGEKHEVKTYDQKHIDKAEVWNNSDGQQQGARYTADGSAPQESAFHKTGSYNDALSNIQSNHSGWSPEAADVNMAKLENAHLLGSPDTVLAHDPSKTLGDIMGAIDPTTGEKVTYQDVFNHLTTNPQTPLSSTEAQVMDMVAQHMSADANGHMGHLIPDVGIKTSDLYSYDQNRPDGIVHNITQDPAMVIPGEKVWVENPNQNLVPYIPPYFLTQVKKLKQIKEKIGALADRLSHKKKNIEPINPNDPIIPITPVKPKNPNEPIIPVTPIITPKPIKKDPADFDFSKLADHVGGTGIPGTYNELDDYLGDDEVKKPAPEKKTVLPPYVLTDKDKASPEYSEALNKALNGDPKAIEAYRLQREMEEKAKNIAPTDKEYINNSLIDQKQLSELKKQFPSHEFKDIKNFGKLNEEEQKHMYALGLDPLKKREKALNDIEKNKATLKAKDSSKEGEISGTVVADRFAQEDIAHNKKMDMSENTPKEYIRTDKEEKTYQEKRTKDKEEFKKTGKLSNLMSLFKRKSR